MTTDNEVKDPPDAVQACLLIEDDKEALSCLKDLIKNWPAEGECKPSLVLLGQGNCVPCNEEYDLHAEAIAAGIIEVVDIYSERGADIAKRNDIEATPALLLLDCTDTIIEQDEASPPVQGV